MCQRSQVAGSKSTSLPAVIDLRAYNEVPSVHVREIHFVDGSPRPAHHRARCDRGSLHAGEGSSLSDAATRWVGESPSSGGATSSGSRLSPRVLQGPTVDVASDLPVEVQAAHCGHSGQWHECLRDRRFGPASHGRCVLGGLLQHRGDQEGSGRALGWLDGRPILSRWRRRGLARRWHPRSTIDPPLLRITLDRRGG